MFIEVVENVSEIVDEILISYLCINSILSSFDIIDVPASLDVDSETIYLSTINVFPPLRRHLGGFYNKTSDRLSSRRLEIDFA